MRLVSALYKGGFPFHYLSKVTDVTSSNDPGDLNNKDILLLHGGSDISPTLYNKKVSIHTAAGPEPSKRDKVEWAMVSRAVDLGIPIIGICRGAQLLTAFVGGTLIQHVNGHLGGHNITTKHGDQLGVNSIHHQMMNPGKVDHQLLAWSSNKQSNVYYDEDTLVDVDKEPECIYFPGIRGFAVQWHPEMMSVNAKSTEWIIEELEELV